MEYYFRNFSCISLYITAANFLNLSPSAMRFVISRTEMSHSPLCSVDDMGGWKTATINYDCVQLVSDIFY